MPATDLPAPDLFAPLSLKRGPAFKNRLALAPLTNQQSHADGTLSDEELHWLTLRAQGGFALTMTCASHVQAVGQGFPGQLGIFGDEHIEGLTRLANAIRAAGSVSSVQLHHAGLRAIANPVGPSDDADSGARALSTAEVEQVRDDFIAAALRAQTAGFDGVEIHGAHGYLLCQFLSPTVNRRTDRYGGSLENRMRLLGEIISGIRRACRADFQLGLRLSAEHFGLSLAEARETARTFLGSGELDFLDMSLWDVMKEPAEEAFQGRSLMSYFTELDRGETRLGVAGKIGDGAMALGCLEQGADFVMIGRGAVMIHDLPNRLARDIGYQLPPLPLSAAHLAGEGLSPTFIAYMRSFKGFVAD